MKSVMLSIQPKWCELIASRQKTIEVRKTAPKLETPFKCYIYCTKDKQQLFEVMKDGDENYGEIYHGKPVFIKRFTSNFTSYTMQKVIGEFVCDNIDEFHKWQLQPSGKFQEAEQVDLDLFLKCSCLSFEEVCAYRKNLPYYKPLYAWHISALKIYDKPKELWEFKPVLSDRDIRCKYISKPYNPYGKQIVHCTLQKCYCEFHSLASQTDCSGYEPLKQIRPLTRPFQSWGYVEELN